MFIRPKKISFTVCAFAGSLLCMSVAQAVPTQITFRNETPLALSTSIAGLPGQGIAANTTKSANYAIVSMGCLYSGNLHNCPIEFSDRATGEKVATVYINAETATLTQPPIFYGNYANEYEVTGWEASPISEISIIKRA